ncbi:MAG: hypothetical protein AMXMBFR23_03250 [Chloroflexota bacterium]
MHLLRDGSLAHFYTDAPESGGTYVGTVAVAPGETPDSDELAKRLGVQWTPFDYDFAVAGGALGTYSLSRKIPKGAKVIGRLVQGGHHRHQRHGRRHPQPRYRGRRGSAGRHRDLHRHHV